ncbi:MAG: hypothetical protein COA83_06950 [Methylophaga sp.]|nr:MAG: hypothetical protein COA83_06950 [Methylophaga sp.]
MQGLEEFATFMSFNSDLSGIRVLSVKSVDRPIKQAMLQQKAEVITMPIVRSKTKNNNEQQLYKSLSFK